MKQFLGLLPLLIAACAPARPSAPDVVPPRHGQVDVPAIAARLFGAANYTNAYNSADSAYVLIVRQPPLTPMAPLPATDFAIVERASGRVTAHETGLPGRVRWHDARTVEVRYTSGTVAGDDAREAVSLLDARTGQPVERPPR